MKKKLLSFALVLTLLLGILAMTSCDPSSAMAENGYLTRAEAEALVAEALAAAQVGTVVEGDNYHVTVDGGEENALVASLAHTLLSSVSVECKFEKTVYSFYGGASTQTSVSQGSGVIYQLDKAKGDAYIITNFHVVYNVDSNTENHISPEISVCLYGQKYEEYKIPATYVGGSMMYDIAVLKVQNSALLRQSIAAQVKVANSDTVAVFDTVAAVGNAEGEGISATVGHVNVDSEKIQMVASDNSGRIELRVMRTDAAVNSDNSGGGLFNAKGELVGIVNAKMATSDVDSIGYAIPSNVATYVADNILYYCDGTDQEQVQRCMLGVNVQIESSQAVYDNESGKVTIAEVVSVSSVSETGTAYGKLQVGDILKSVSIDGKSYAITRNFHVLDNMLNARVGSTVVFTVERGDLEIPVSMVMTEQSLTQTK